MQSISDNPALRAQLESQVNFMTELAQKTYDSVRRLAEINLQLAQQMIEDSMNISREMMTCTDPMQLAQVAMKQVQPASEHLRNYQQQLMTVLSGAQQEFTRAAQTHIPEASRNVSALAEQMVRTARAGANAGGPGSASSGNGSGSGDGPARNPS